jgi:hypothetical protein
LDGVEGGFMRRASHFVLALSAAGTLLIGSEAALAEEVVYAATMSAPKGLAGEKTARLTLTVQEFTTDEEALALRDAIAKNGTEGLIEVLRDKDKGVAHITGGVTAKIVHVRVTEGQNANTIVVVTDKPLYFPEDTPNRIPENAIGIINIVMNASGKGRGTLAEAVKVRLTPAGVFEVEAQNNAPIEIREVERLK